MGKDFWNEVYSLDEDGIILFTNYIKPKYVIPIHYNSIVGKKERIIKYARYIGSSNESIDADDFYVYIHTSDTGIESVKFALKSDVETKNEDGSSNIGDGFAKTYSFIPNGTFTKSDPVDGCKLQFDTQGRIHTISIPEYDTQRNLIGYRDVELTAKTVTDEAAYQDAYNEYEKKYSID